jgi:enamine deaminase RidA (YjgF/YER057c/UK114 family)
MGLMWNMPVPVACSLAVAADGIAATCGQCPLDDDGLMQLPGDGAAQAALVARMGQGVLSHLPGYEAALLTVYHNCTDADEVLSPLAAAFPQAALAPVRLPHFYYPGMRIEVDLYATAGTPRTTRFTSGRASLTIVEGGPLTLCHLAGPDMASCQPLLSRIDEVRLLTAQWFAPEAPQSHLPDPAARVIPPTPGVTAVLIIAAEPVRVATTPGGAILRQAGRFAWASATGTAADLAQAAHQAMDRLALDRMPDFTPLKATTHYAGGPGPEDLHGNLAVRHARFPSPGPASTGVPVTTLTQATLAIDMLGLIDSHDASA